MKKVTQKTILIYNKIAKDYAKRQEVLFPEKDAEKFFQLIKNGSKILDIGCASGRDVKQFTDLGFNVIGIDLSENLLKLAKKISIS